MASKSRSKRPSTKKLARTLKVPISGRKADKDIGAAHPPTQHSVSTAEQEHRRLTLADIWDEEDAAFFQPYFDKLAAGGL